LPGGHANIEQENVIWITHFGGPSRQLAVGGRTEFSFAASCLWRSASAAHGLRIILL
jgi:hypothetical protein